MSLSQRTRSAAAATLLVSFASVSAACGGVSVPATSARPESAETSRLRRQYARELDACLALGGEAATGPSLDYPEFLLDGFDEDRAPRAVAQLEREIAFATRLLGSASVDADRKASLLFEVSRLRLELSRTKSGDEALALRRQEAETLTRFVSENEGSDLMQFALLELGRARLVTADRAGAKEAFDKLLTIERAEEHVRAAAQVNLALMTLADGDRDAAIELLDESTRNSSSRGARREWHRANRLFEALAPYHKAWLYRRAGDETHALPAFRRAMNVAQNDDREPFGTSMVEAAAADEICALERAQQPPRPRAEPPSGAPSGETEAPRSFLRVLHASGAANAQGVSLFLDATTTPVLNGARAKATIEYAQVEPGTHAIAFRPDGATEGDALLGSPLGELLPFHAYTVVLFGGSGRNEPLALAVHEDVPVDSEDQRNTLRFFNAMSGAAELEICRDRAREGLQPAFAGATYGGYGVPFFGLGASPVDPMSNAVEIYSNGVVELEVRVAGRTLCGGRKLGVVRFSASSGLNGTMIAFGSAVGRGPREMFMCADAPSDTNCIVVDLAAR